MRQKYGLNNFLLLKKDHKSYDSAAYSTLSSCFTWKKQKYRFPKSCFKLNANAAFIRVFVSDIYKEKNKNQNNNNVTEKSIENISFITPNQNKNNNKHDEDGHLV